MGTALKAMFKDFCNNYKHYCVVFAMGVITCASSSLLQDTNFDECLGNKLLTEIKVATQGGNNDTFQ